MIPGFSTLHLAARNSQPECLKRLLQVKTKKRSVNSRAGIQAVSWPTPCWSGSHFCFCHFWQERLAVDCTDSIGRTPLHHAGTSTFIIDPPQHILKPLPSKQWTGVVHRSIRKILTQLQDVRLCTTLIISCSCQWLFALHWDLVGL